ncbi:ATP-binding cassette domain-containing protein [Kribbella sp. NPDC026596]|uniref:ABC transporter ATP-binding protein n=1 Tax=Kribbella sp. NPDC026596 TaxID=3155122 RepID=UPI0034039264
MVMIQVQDLVKEFSRPAVQRGRFAGLRSLFTTERTVTRAVDGLSFDIEPGELVGYLGPNGAGKSTTIKMLTGILVPTSGRLVVAGQVPWQDRRSSSRNIGVVFGQRTQLWYDLPLRDSFEALRDLYEIDAATYLQRMGTFTEMLGLDEFIDTPVRSLSLGQRMRGDLVAAMLHAPPIVYLDEPTVGLDVVAKARIREFVAESNTSSGTTIMLTTHDMDDVEQLCRRIIIIDSGRVLYDGDLDTLKARYVPYRDLVVTPADGVDPSTIRMPLAQTRIDDQGRALLRFDPAEIPSPKLISEVTSAHGIVDLTVREPDLEDVIHRLYGEGAG